MTCAVVSSGFVPRWPVVLVCLAAGRPRFPPGYPPASFLPYPDLMLRRHPAALALPLKFTPLSTFTIRFRFKARAVRKAWMA
jgi:hypothetical protein